ncbi:MULTISPECIES: DUF2218 domain-containing protein [unclassified Ensifer]|uniref:DUF2218 domain-containing protein n=1 Tax=unclassified Ensifer TaxID=2633371 RepID=UPI000813D67D|nr:MULTISPECIES: DUF2218 domain-containing protein [unclassified Ensifer]OCP00456.1 hypothetical protein BC362_23970 [Ensifer sp. LC14]OCP05831.1 hypothetical protein BBX50_04935 [Ensifer sp. LC11]OCP06575.1 hypothetical protein BC374_04995 [Ensifer sp. LC13]OCP31185.1 hypothetical protein BC364_05100 [Ensifer sp. LC499]
MQEATTHFATEEGQKYLAQLCKHFAHKIDVEQAGDRAELRFSCGTGYLHATPDGLNIRARSPDDADLDDTKSVIESHLLRFAFREEPRQLHWQAAG